MDARKILAQGSGVTEDLTYLRRHTEAIRDNQISVALMFLYLQGYDIQLEYMGEPRVSEAREIFNELTNAEKISLWSMSTTKGGVWETWQRDALKYGNLETTKAWETWKARQEI